MAHPAYRPIMIGTLLAILMAATRFGHFGSAISLPDASLAVFFLAGFYLSARMFPLLLLEAAAVDYLAINMAGVSDWCVTPAYAFLAAAYAVPWLAGRWYARWHALTWRSSLLFAATAAIATVMAFLISNASFYAFSGYFTEMAALEYASRVIRYLTPYLRSTMLWLTLAAIVHVLLSLAAQRQALQADA